MDQTEQHRPQQPQGPFPSGEDRPGQRCQWGIEQQLGRGRAGASRPDVLSIAKE
jgi:hypothetical protein